MRLSTLGTGPSRAGKVSQVVDEETAMDTVARVTEITAESEVSFEDAIKVGLERAAQTLREIRSAWVKEQHVRVQDNRVVAYRVDMLVTFILAD